MEVKYKVLDLDSEGIEDAKMFRDRLLSRPSSGSAGRTGTWRLYRPEISLEKCTRCGICWLYCPDDVISWKPREYPKIDMEYCKGCGVCADVCPVGAIEMVLEGE